jgi:hypothetical protein
MGFSSRVSDCLQRDLHQYFLDIHHIDIHGIHFVREFPQQKAIKFPRSGTLHYRPARSMTKDFELTPCIFLKNNSLGDIVSPVIELHQF